MFRREQGESGGARRAEPPARRTETSARLGAEWPGLPRHEPAGFPESGRCGRGGYLGCRTGLLRQAGRAGRCLRLCGTGRGDDLPDQSQNGRKGFVAGLWLHALAFNRGQERSRRQCGDRPGNGQRIGGLCHCARGQLFRYVSGLLPRHFRTGYRHRPQPASPQQILHSHQAFQFRPFYLEPGSLFGHVS